MHVTACLAGQEVDVEVGEDCRTLQALREAIVVALPQLCVEGLKKWFDVSVGGRPLDDDEGVVSLQEGMCLDVSANSRALSVLALREAGREVSEAGLLNAAGDGDASLVTLFLDAGVPIDPADIQGQTPLHRSCLHGNLEIATLLLDRGSTAIDAKTDSGKTPLHMSCGGGYLEITTLLLDRGTTAINEEDDIGRTPLDSCWGTKKLETADLLLARGCSVDERFKAKSYHPRELLDLLSKHGHDVLPDAPPTCAKRRRIGKQ